jgi:hypothetical protein
VYTVLARDDDIDALIDAVLTMRLKNGEKIQKIEAIVSKWEAMNFYVEYCAVQEVVGYALGCLNNHSASLSAVHLDIVRRVLRRLRGKLDIMGLSDWSKQTDILVNTDAYFDLRYELGSCVDTFLECLCASVDTENTRRSRLVHDAMFGTNVSVLPIARLVYEYRRTGLRVRNFVLI